MSQTPNHFTLHETGLRGRLPAENAGPDFWTQVGAAVAGHGLEAMAGDIPGTGSGMRVWLLLNRIGGEEVGAMAGLALTRALAERGRRTVLIDADEPESLLTRRSGRLFRSGWLDMARYGASLASAAVAVDWAGRLGHFLGLGSYCPVEITPGEIQGLMSSLQLQVDELVVVCGQGPEAGPWAEVAGEVLYCWDREKDSAVVLEAVRMDLAQRGLACGGALVFDAVSAAATAPVTGNESPEDLEPVAAAPEPGPATETVSRFGSADPAQDVHSSGVFRVVAIAGLAAVIVLAIFIWKFTGIGGQGGVETPVATLDQGLPAGTPVADSVVNIPAEIDSTLYAAVQNDSLTAAGEYPAAADSQTLDLADRALAAAEQVDEGDAGVTVSAEPSPDPRQAWNLVAPSFSGPVGEKGWCLHVYSLRDSSAAQREIRMVQRRGVTAVMAPVVLPDSTRWFRIYTGNFATRSEASRAEPALKWKLRTDWARPVVRPDSARD